MNWSTPLDEAREREMRTGCRTHGRRVSSSGSGSAFPNASPAAAARLGSVILLAVLLCVCIAAAATGNYVVCAILALFVIDFGARR